MTYPEVSEIRHLTLSNHRDTICGLTFIEHDPGIIWTYAEDIDIRCGCVNCAHVMALAYNEAGGLQ